MGLTDIAEAARAADVTAFCLGNLRFRLMSEIIWHPDMTEEEYNERRDRILKEEYGEGWSWVLDFIEIWESTEVGCWNCWSFFALISTGEFDIEEYSRRADEMYSLLERAYALCESKEEAKAMLREDYERYKTVEEGLSWRFYDRISEKKPESASVKEKQKDDL